MQKLLQSKKRMLLTLSLMFFAIMILVASLHEDGLLAVYRMEIELSNLQKGHDQIMIRNKHLREEIQGLKTSPTGIEKIAREKLSLVRPGEVIYRIVQSDPFHP